MNNLKLFGKRIKELRKNKKLTQEQLGELVRIDYKQIGNIETGTYFTTMPTLEKIANALDVEIAELFNYSHKNTRRFLIEKPIQMLSNASDENLAILYRVIKSILQ